MHANLVLCSDRFGTRGLWATKMFQFFPTFYIELEGSKVQELNSGPEASFPFFIGNIFCSAKRKNIAFRLFFVQFYDNSS